MLIRKRTSFSRIPLPALFPFKTARDLPGDRPTMPRVIDLTGWSYFAFVHITIGMNALMWL
uniref:Uncharacterized protein n=1 Tax=Daphnia magna TaxID=35525 RepID=A0A0P6HR63_9CRUS